MPVLECHVSGDLGKHLVGLECVVTAVILGAAEVLVDWVASSIAHRVDLLAGPATGEARWAQRTGAFIGRRGTT